MKRLLILLPAFLLLSCEKKELPVKKYDRGDVLTTQIAMGSDYRWQVWFSLNDNKVASTNLKSAWDLAFEASVDGIHIMLNGSKAMRAYKTNAGSLADIKDTVGLAAYGKADAPSGDMDSTAIGDWRKDNKVYVINRGYNESAISQGYYKIRIISASASQFIFEYGDVYGTEVYTGSVTKDAHYNFVYFSLSEHAQKQPEPARTAYDLCFTQYTHIFTDPFQYYQVTGVLSNNNNTHIGLIKNKAFASIGISDTLSCTFEAQRNAIGYDWKTFDLNTNLYTVDPTRCYIIRDTKGFYYKLHFIDFVNTSGVKGYPKFEFRKL